MCTEDFHTADFHGRFSYFCSLKDVRRPVNTHVDNDTFTEVVVVWDVFEVLHSSELAVRGRSVLVLAAQFRQRPVKHDKVTS